MKQYSQTWHDHNEKTRKHIGASMAAICYTLKLSSYSIMLIASNASGKHVAMKHQIKSEASKTDAKKSEVSL